MKSKSIERAVAWLLERYAPRSLVLDYLDE